MIRLTPKQLVDIIYSSDPIGLYESILESLRGQSELVDDENGALDDAINESLINMFDSEDDGFSDDWIEEDYRDSFFDDHEIDDFPL